MKGIIGGIVMDFESVDSTNNYMKSKLVSNRLKDGLLVRTKKQHSGRGQQGNVWESGVDENLLFSFVVYPSFLNIERQFVLSKAISLAVVDFVSQYAENVCVKWPNDIYVNDKKIAGILIENTIKGLKISSSVIGVGININQENFSKDLPNPVSLAMLCKKEFDNNELMASLIEKLNVWYNKLLLKQEKLIDKQYIDKLYRFNELHDYIVDGEIITAKITGIDADGRLIVKIGDGQRKFAFKEIGYVINNLDDLK